MQIGYPLEVRQKYEIPIYATLKTFMLRSASGLAHENNIKEPELR